jgi:hypothetical protein
MDFKIHLSPLASAAAARKLPLSADDLMAPLF